MNRCVTRQQRKKLETENKHWPSRLKIIPKSEWPFVLPSLVRVWRSRDYLVQEYEEAGCIRLSVNRAILTPDGDWSDNLEWEELQEIKQQCGYGDRMAVEIFPADRDIVNVGNMRHLWVLPEPLEVGWRK